MVARKAIPDEDHVSRFAPYSRQFRDPETDELIGLAPAACAIREADKGGLSVNWIEFYGAFNAAAKKAAAIGYRSTLAKNKLPSKGAFGYANVGKLREVCALAGKKIRVVHAPVDGNDAHAEIRHFSDEDFGLLDELATNAFVDLDVVAEMKLP
ncbi:hypothetical protein [Qipengyuania sp. NPDC077563]|uniref:hypothetical protein n=1 Tax=Qipengyuania sp. NPDC077563 TaxID=3364497 RepID=UPI00384CCC0F